MNGVGIGCGIIGATAIVAITYMMGHGYQWWQIALVVLLEICFSPQYRRSVDE